MSEDENQDLIEASSASEAHEKVGRLDEAQTASLEKMDAQAGETSNLSSSASVSGSPKDSSKMKWYVVHTYSGFEAKAKKALEERVRSLGKEQDFGEVLVPSENVVEMHQGQKKTTTKKFFPGYILVQMVLNEENWHVVKNTPKITGFVGRGTMPPAVPQHEVEKITKQMTEGAESPKLRMSFDKGESVRVIDGPFQGFNGLVDEVKPDKGKLRVLVSIFGRSTPVELDYAQVEKG